MGLYEDNGIIEAVPQLRTGYNGPQGLQNSVRRFLDAVRVYEIFGEKFYRIGNPHDGGYIALKDVCERTRFVYSFGIGDDVGFEKDFAECSHPKKIYLFDPTISKAPEDHPCFEFSQKSAMDWQGRSSNLDILQENALLKVDIEYDEWYFFLEIGEDHLKKFSQILLELHLVHCEPRASLTPYFQVFYQRAMDRVNERLFTLYGNVMVKLSKDFYAFHIHANNSLPLISVGGYAFPPLIEMSFVRKDLVGEVRQTKRSFPVPVLDAPNKTDRPDFINIYPLGGISWA